MAIGLSGSQDLTRTASLPAEAAPFTITFWTRIASIPDGTNRQQYILFDGTGRIHEVLITGASSSPHELKFAGTSSSGVYLVTHSIANDTWKFCAAVYETDGTVRVYSADEGAETLTESSSTHNGVTRVPTTLRFGANTFSAARHVGFLAMGRVWEAALTAEQVLAEFQSASAALATDLYADWPMADADTATNDTSGASRSLTVVGTLSTETGPDVGSELETITGEITESQAGQTDEASGSPIVAGELTEMQAGQTDALTSLSTITGTITETQSGQTDSLTAPRSLVELLSPLTTESDDRITTEAGDVLVGVSFGEAEAITAGILATATITPAPRASATITAAPRVAATIERAA
jgi:hypothetical protein